MKYYRLFMALLVFVITAAAVTDPSNISQAGARPLPRSFDDGLRAVLSFNATISHKLASAPLWSEYHAPQPGIIVNVVVENDVQVVVKKPCSSFSPECVTLIKK